VRVTRQDYERELFQTVATNNLNGTRALLNAGTDINAKNHYGETPLQVARRAGAVDTANLLMARGAR
jgi:ankyrin repeat protein